MSLEIDLSAIGEPILCCPNDPDDARFLSDIESCPVDEVFIGSCMTRASHFEQAAALLPDAPVPVRLWMAPQTKLDQEKLIQGGAYAKFHTVAARMEMPGCSLCMGNQARVQDGATVVSTSTRNFPNRMGRDARVYLASAEVAALTARLGRLPPRAEYLEAITASA